MSKFISTACLILLLAIGNYVFSQNEATHVSNSITNFDTSKILDRGILKAINKLQQITGNKIKTYKTNIGPIYSHPNDGIVLNLKEITMLIQKFEGDFSVNDLITLILCHEAAHIYQFTSLKIDTLRNINSENRRLFEIQADILSGVYFMQFYNLEDYDFFFKENLERNLKRMFALENFFSDFKIDYPNPSQRIFSIMLGIDAGVLKLTSQYGSDENAKEVKSLQSRLELNNLKINEWSLLQAKKIINFRNDASRSIALESKNIIDTFGSGKVKYHLIYKNIGISEVEVDMSIVSANDFSLEIVDRKNHKFKLLPGQTISLEGELSNGNNKNKNVHIIFPPNQGCLVNFDIPINVSNSIAEVLTYSYSSWKNQFSKFGLHAFFIDDLMNIVRTGNLSLAYGPAEYFQGALSYKSLFAYPTSLDNKFLIKDKKISFRSILYSGYSYEKANNIYNSTAQELEKALKKLKLVYRINQKKIEGDNDDIYQNAELIFDALKVKINLELNLIPVWERVRRGHTIITQVEREDIDVVITFSRI